MERAVIFFQADQWRNSAGVDVAELGWQTGRYPNGEQWVHLTEGLTEVGDLTVLAGFHDQEPLDQQLMRLWLLLEMARRTAGKLHLFMPYAPYSLQDRDVRGGDAAAALAVGKTIAALGVDHLSVVDVHNPEALTRWTVPVTNLDASRLLSAMIQTDLAGRHLAIVAPDAGAAAKAAVLSRLLQAPCYQFTKERRGPGDVTIEGDLSNCSADTILLVDDLVNTGGTLIAATKIVRQQCSMAQAAIVATHALLANQAWEKLQAAGISQAFFTNSYLAAPLRAGTQTNLRIADIGSLFRD